MSDSPSVDVARERAIADANVKNADAAYNNLQKAYDEAVRRRERLMRDRSTLLSVGSTLSLQQDRIRDEIEKLQKAIEEFKGAKSSYESALDSFNRSISDVISEIRSIRDEARRAYRHAEEILAAAGKLSDFSYHEGTVIWFTRLNTLDELIDALIRQTEELRSIDRMLSRDRTADLSDAIMQQTQEKLSGMSDECRDTYRDLIEKCNALKDLRGALSDYLR